MDGGGGLNYLVRQKYRFQCPDCREDLVEGSLAAQHPMHHVWGRETQRVGAPPPPVEYRVYFLRNPWTVACPVKDCRWGGAIRANPRFHFVKCHMQDKIVILE